MKLTPFANRSNNYVLLHPVALPSKANPILVTILSHPEGHLTSVLRMRWNHLLFSIRVGRSVTGGGQALPKLRRRLTTSESESFPAIAFSVACSDAHAFTNRANPFYLIKLVCNVFFLAILYTLSPS